jgi:hypothetical protein
MVDNVQAVCVSIDDINCIFPDEENDFFFPPNTFLNGFCFREGYQFGYGHVLLLKQDLDLLPRKGLTLKIQSLDQTIEIKNLLIVDTSTGSATAKDNDLVLVKLADTRFFLQKNRTWETPEDKFPPAPWLDQTGFATTWENAIDAYWDDLTFSQTLDQTNVDYPTKILRDVETGNICGSFETICNVLSLCTHGLFYDGENYKIIPFRTPNDTNATLVAQNRKFLINAKNDQSEKAAKLPQTLRVKFRHVDDILFDKQLSYDINYGGALTTGDFSRDMRVFNLYDPNWDVQFNSEAYEPDLSDFADELSDLYFDSFGSWTKLDATYFGLIPFEHAPNVSTLMYYHDVNDGAYKTRIKSFEPGDHKFNSFAKFISFPENQTVNIKAPVDGIPARSGAILGGPIECDILSSQGLANGTRELITTTFTLEVHNQISVVVLDKGLRLGMASQLPDKHWEASVGDCKDEATDDDIINTEGKKGLSVTSPSDQYLVKGSAMTTHSFSPTGGTGPYTTSVYSGGSLPTGVTLASNQLSGTPTEAVVGRSWVFLTKDTSNNAAILSDPVYIEVADPLEMINGLDSATTIEFTKDEQFTYQLFNSGGRTPYVWTKTSGTWPTGMSDSDLATSGLIEGTPTATNAGTVMVFNVEDENGNDTDTANVTFVVNDVLSDSFPSSLTFTQDENTIITLETSGGTEPITFSLDDGDELPPGLMLMQDGIRTAWIIGKVPSGTGSASSFQINAVDKWGSSTNSGLITILIST